MTTFSELADDYDACCPTSGRGANASASSRDVERWFLAAYRDAGGAWC